MSSVRGKTAGFCSSRKGDSSCINPMVGLERELGGNDGLDEPSVNGDLAGISQTSSRSSTSSVLGAASYGEGLLDGVVVYRNDCRGCVMRSPSRKEKEREKMEPLHFASLSWVDIEISIQISL